MELFFTTPDQISSGRASFDQFESRHILRTLRKGTGDLIDFTDGQGAHYQGRIIHERPLLQTQANLIERHQRPAIKLAASIGFIKQTRLDFIIEKGTELGIDLFMFFNSKFSNYFTDNISRWEKISRQAVKQSVRYFLPEFSVFRSFPEFLDAAEGFEIKLLAEQSAGSRWQDLVPVISPAAGDLLITVGPEGGLDESEIHNALSRGFKGISFGNHRLRTETAVFSAATLLNLLRT
jgi:16S rRNA (uracil1498-N3)-methyltransferase